MARLKTRTALSCSGRMGAGIECVVCLIGFFRFFVVAWMGTNGFGFIVLFCLFRLNTHDADFVSLLYHHCLQRSKIMACGSGDAYIQQQLGNYIHYLGSRMQASLMLHASIIPSSCATSVTVLSTS